MMKSTYGTGCFALLNTGERRGRLAQPPAHDASPTGSAARPPTRSRAAIFVAGAAVQWLRDGLRLIGACRRDRAAGGRASTDTGGVYLVPAFAGLGAPLLGPGRARRASSA